MVTLRTHPWKLSIAKIARSQWRGIEDAAFLSVLVAPQECSIVTETARLPTNVMQRNDGWRCLEVVGPLDFALTGILSGISRVLAEAKISIFAVSSFDTDFILVKEETLEAASTALRQANYEVIDALQQRC